MKSLRAFLVLLIAGLAILAAVGWIAPPAGAQATLATIVLPEQPWTDTGITVTAGQPLMISASGTIHFVNRRGYPASPAGTASCLKLRFGPFEAPSLTCFSLIGKVGATGAPFEVGADYSSASFPASGELFLGPNDDKYPDNAGSWVAIVTGGISSNVPPTTQPTILSTTQPTTPATTQPTTPPTTQATISSTAQPPPTAQSTTTRTGNWLITDSTSITPDEASTTGLLAFTGWSPLEQMITFFGFLLFLVGLALYFLGSDFRSLALWLLGL